MVVVHRLFRSYFVRLFYLFLGAVLMYNRVKMDVANEEQNCNLRKL
jgi:hypothetical protein